MMVDRELVKSNIRCRKLITGLDDTKYNFFRVVNQYIVTIVNCSEQIRSYTSDVVDKSTVDVFVLVDIHSTLYTKRYYKDDTFYPNL